MYCALLALAPQWKAKSQLYLRVASHRYDDTIKIENLRQNRSSLKQKSSFFVCKRTGFVNQMLGKFVKMTLTRVMSDCLRLESSHSVKNVTRVTIVSQRDSSRAIDWNHAITAVCGNRSYHIIPSFFEPHCCYFKYFAYCHLYLKKTCPRTQRELAKG